MYDITKQPVWVQDEMAVKDRIIARLEQELLALGPEVPYAGDLTRERPIGIAIGMDRIKTLPSHTAVSFKQPRRGGYITISQRSDGKATLEVYYSGFPGTLTVEPKSSNTFDIRVREED